MKNYLVFDAGGTFTKYALMDENAEILEIHLILLTFDNLFYCKEKVILRIMFRLIS